MQSSVPLETISLLRPEILKSQLLKSNWRFKKKSIKIIYYYHVVSAVNVKVFNCEILCDRCLVLGEEPLDMCRLLLTFVSEQKRSWWAFFMLFPLTEVADKREPTPRSGCSNWCLIARGDEMIPWLFERDQRHKRTVSNERCCNNWQTRAHECAICTFLTCGWDAHRSHPNSFQRLKPSRMPLLSLSIYLVGPRYTLLPHTTSLPSSLEDSCSSNAVLPYFRHLTGMEMRCKSTPSFPACTHLSKLRALVTATRSVGVTPDRCQFGSEVWWSLLLLGKQGESLYEQWNGCRDAFGDHYHVAEWGLKLYVLSLMSLTFAELPLDD